jgi:hypothetical protein
MHVQQRLLRQIQSRDASAASLALPHLQMNNAELRRAVRQTLQQKDCTTDYKVGACCSDLALYLGVRVEVLQQAVPNISAVIQDEWLTMFGSAWSLFLHDSEVNDQWCLACVWCHNVSRPVLTQCDKLRCSGQEFCIQHGSGQGSRQTRSYFGKWDPSCLRSSVPAIKLALAIRAAKSRATLPSPGSVQGESVRGFRHPRLRPVHVQQPARSVTAVSRQSGIEQPVYCPSLSGALRCFEAVPSAMPPCPCMLCPNTNFASNEQLFKHVAQDHVPAGVGPLSQHRVEEEYRKTVLSLSSRFDAVSRLSHNCGVLL